MEKSVEDFKPRNIESSVWKMKNKVEQVFIYYMLRSLKYI